MNKCAALLVAVISLTVVTPECPAQLQLFGGKKAKASPQQRVPELLGALKFEKDSHRRADAAEELRQFEVKDFPEIVPMLIDALQTDPVASVRIESATSLGRMRPISSEAGMALEKAAAGDSNMLVRMQANTSLIYYKLCGYKSPKADQHGQGPDLKVRTDEPPLAGDAWWKGAPTPAKAGVAVTPDLHRPLPTGPTQNGKIPITTVPTTPPVSGGGVQGPILQPTPPLVQTPPGVWSPINDSGPPLVPPKK